MTKMAGMVPAAPSLPEVIIYLVVPEALWIRHGNTRRSI